MPRRISVRLGEELAATDFGRCIAEQIAARAEAFDPPPEVTRAKASFTVTTPIAGP